MKYQFDNPPTREAIIQEFGINHERLHRIETFIQSIAPISDDFELPDGNQLSMGESAFVLKRLNLIEAFALLCSSPSASRAEIVILPAFDLGLLGNVGLVSICAAFDKFGVLVTWKAERIPFVNSQPWFLASATRSPSDLANDQEWMAAHFETAADAAILMAGFEGANAVAAVSRCPLSPLQWRRKIIAEGWLNPTLTVSARLVDDGDLMEWNEFLANPDKSLSDLRRFEQWAQGRDSWDGWPPSE